MYTPILTAFIEYMRSLGIKAEVAMDPECRFYMHLEGRTGEDTFPFILQPSARLLMLELCAISGKLYMQHGLITQEQSIGLLQKLFPIYERIDLQELMEKS